MLNVKVTVRRRTRRRILAGHAVTALAVLAYAAFVATGPGRWFLVLAGLESLAFTAVYVLVLAAPPRRVLRPRTEARPAANRPGATSGGKPAATPPA